MLSQFFSLNFLWNEAQKMWIKWEEFNFHGVISISLLQLSDYIHLIPTASTCPKVRNLVLCHLWFQPHHKYFPNQRPENEVGCFFPFQHSSTTHLENSKIHTHTHTNHLFSSYIYCAFLLLKDFGEKILLNC